MNALEFVKNNLGISSLISDETQGLTIKNIEFLDCNCVENDDDNPEDDFCNGVNCS